MRLLELVQGEDTKSEVIDCLDAFCDRKLGKGVVVCNDTPGFLGNRVGVYAIQKALHTAFEMGLAPEQADAIFGRPLGIPKTGVFGLYDLIGIDLMSDVAASLESILPQDDPFHRVAAKLPVMERMIEAGLIGNKGGKGGFYQPADAGKGVSRKTLDFDSFEYREFQPCKPQAAIDAELSGDFTPLLDLVGDQGTASLVRIGAKRSRWWASQGVASSAHSRGRCCRIHCATRPRWYPTSTSLSLQSTTQ